MARNVNRYTFRVEWSEEDAVHIGRCLEFPSLRGHGKTPESALKQIKAAVRHSLEWLEEEGEAIPEPLGLRKFKGNLIVRTSPDIHRQVAMKSAEQGISINQYIISKIIESR